jgi:eukaryotic-like serine/threonine-protein kinase
LTDLKDQLRRALGSNYTIERELGGGGMSRVFLAEETALARKVVIKVLPTDLAAGLNADRFRREIQLAAKLQHPHIVPLLAVGAKGGLLYYTMPFISGENLRARLVRLRELPIADATRILREVADALEYAHEQGVVHRDIKPENILLSGSHALVIDFGVSKALSSATAETRVEGGPVLTSLGIALGTPTYMAPEQAAADPNVDHRADIYSLGVVGYELLAGRPPFTGMTPQATLSAQVTMNPDPVEQHRPNIPPALSATIMRCLEKHPSDRWQTAGELRTQLETVFTPSGATQPVAAARPAFRWTPRRMMIAAAVAGVVIAGVFLSTIAFKKEDAGFSIGANHQVTNLPGVELYPAISPDGKMVAYVASHAGKAQIFVRQISGGRAVPLTDGATNAVWPRWKPDGSALVYTSDGTAFTIPPLGGSPMALLPKSASGSYVFCEWSPSGSTIVCGNTVDGALYLADAIGENVRRLTPPSDDVLHSASWSPDGKRIAYVSGNSFFVGWGGLLGNQAASSIWVIPISGGAPARITDETHLNTSPVWTADGGRVLFVSSLGGTRDIYAQKVNSRSEAIGAPFRLTTGLNPHTISLSADGRYLAYSTFITTANLWSASLDGLDPVSQASMRQITFGNQTIEAVAVSPDERWLAFDSNVSGNSDIYKISVEGGEPQQLTRDPADDFSPAWSPDGSEIAFHSFRNGTRDVFVMSADGSRVQTVVASPRQERQASWSPDGRSMSFTVMPDSIFVVARAGAGWGSPRFFRKGLLGAWSPDGKTIAVVTEDQGGIDLSPVDATQPTVAAVRAAVGDQIYGLAWSRDSRLVYYGWVGGDGTTSIWSVPAAGGAPRQLLQFTDPLRQLYRGFIAVDSRHVYFSIGSRESDVWVMELMQK